MVELYLLFAVVVSIIAFVNGVQEAIEGVMVFGVLLALEKLVTVYHANHFLDEFLPLEKEIRVKPKLD